MAKDNRLIGLILDCQLLKPGFYLNQLKKNYFNSNQDDNQIIDTSINFLSISMIHCYGCYDKTNNCLVYNHMCSDY